MTGALVIPKQGKKLERMATMSVTKLRLAGESKRPLSRRIVFTIDALNRAAVQGGKGRSWIYDAKLPGLCLMVTATGAKSFYLYRKVNGRPQQVRIGTYPAVSIEQARKTATQLNAKANDGIDLQAERRGIRQDATLQEAWDRYLSDYAEGRLRPHSLVTDKSRFKTCLAVWASRRIRSLRGDDVQRLMADTAKERGQVSANRAVQLLRRVLAYHKVTPNPAARGEVRFFHEEKRERYLSGEELVRLVDAIDSEPNTTIADLVRVCLLTGQRRGNVASMKWEELDMSGAVWSIPGTKFKTGKPHAVPLAVPVLAVLKAREGNKSDYVFPARRGDAGHITDPQIGWERILERAKLKDVHLHDLRHTFASWAIQNGASLFAVGRTLGHASQTSTARYSHLATDQLRATVVTSTGAMQAAMDVIRSEAKAKAKPN
ncbi:MAG: site-specific integrase [Planctomycetia bacterium]|nr:site-specific integrase [Planctomycetia bacterium]